MSQVVHVGLLGWPVGHSISPAMHNAAFEALGLRWQYSALAVRPADLHAEIDQRITEEGYRGFNVTIPHKRAILQHPRVTVRSPAVEMIGAANTITVQPDSSLHVDNTDWRGFANDLEEHGVSAGGAACVLLGSGGSAQAIAYALEQLGAASVTTVSRRPDGRPGMVGYDMLPQLAADLIVNCTPLGMSPDTNRSPWPDAVPFPSGATLYDLIYNPPVTRLMIQAGEAGAQAIGGLGMLVWQGALSFEQWTGSAPPVNVMVAAAQTALME